MSEPNGPSPRALAAFVAALSITVGVSPSALLAQTTSPAPEVKDTGAVQIKAGRGAPLPGAIQRKDRTGGLETVGAERLRADQLKAEQLKAEQLKAEQLKAEQLKAEQLKAEQLKAEQLKAEQLKAEQLKAMQHKRIDAVQAKGTVQGTPL